MRLTVRLAVIATLVPSLLVTSCLSSSYRLSQDELSRLARTAPEQRWQGVRATQRLFGSDTPPAAETLPSTQPTVVVPSVFWFHGRSRTAPWAWRNSTLGWSSGSTRRSTRTSGTSGSSGGGTGGGTGRGGEALVVLVVVVAAAAMVFVLAGSEGARYDGWLALPPDELLYLDEPDGSTVAVPLTGLTPELADQARGASIYEGTTERYLQLGRAPLDRRGFSLQSGLLVSAMPRVGVPDGGYAAGFGGRMFFGGFPIHEVGFGAAADVVGGSDGSVLASAGVEVQVMPVTYAGAYVSGGWTVLAPGGSGREVGTWNARAGAQFELPFTTRLSGTLRTGVLRVDGGGVFPTMWAPELALSLSVY